MTPCEKLGYKVGDRFEVVEDSPTKSLVKGDIAVLRSDDGSGCPDFVNERTGNEDCCIPIDRLRKISTTPTFTPQPGDYINTSEMSESGMREVVAAFLAAGCPEGEEYIYVTGHWDFIGWDGGEGVHYCDTNPESLTREITLQQLRGYVVAAKEWPAVGDVVDVHNDNGYVVGYGHCVIGKKATVKSVFSIQGVPIAAVEYDKSGYCFRVDMLRPIRTERERLIEQLQQAAGITTEQAARAVDAGWKP
jgi:hypothetical protein